MNVKTTPKEKAVKNVLLEVMETQPQLVAFLVTATVMATIKLDNVIQIQEK